MAEKQSMDFDALGDRMKMYERVNTGRVAFKGSPIVCRLDGHGFHRFTKGMRRPFDSSMSELMIDTTKYLVQMFNAQFGYTQSDEITLVWYIPSDSNSEYIFGGRYQKFDSLLAASASAYLMNALTTDKFKNVFPPDKYSRVVTFDARTFSVPNLTEAINCVLWRQMDATKNAISMAASSVFTHKSLQGKSGAEKVQRLKEEAGIDFNQYPIHFKRGSFIVRVSSERALSEQELLKIPLERRPSGPVFRNSLETAGMWLSKFDAAYRHVMLFDPNGAKPYVTNTLVNSY